MALQDDAQVLVVDDQPGKLLTYQAILDGIHARLVTAGSAREALDHLLKTEFAVVLVDVCMPELDGFELAAMIREHPRFRRTAIIFVSGVHLSDLDRLKGYQIGAVDYLPVPIIPEILRAKVGVFVELYRKTREVEGLNRELEQRVAERTAELEDAGRHKDEFLAVLAHELRNPLAAIRSASQLIGLQNAPPALLTKSGEVINRQVEHLVRLIDDLVDVSRITRGVIELQLADIEIGDVIEQAIEASRPLVESRGHALAVNLSAASLMVHGDNTRLMQVVSNLLNNAAKFTDPGGHITLTARERDGHVLIEVTDTGVGIDPEMLPRLFKLFAQAERPIDRASTGLGIGLALVRRLVEMHGGTVTAHSAGRGRGTQVSVNLPLLVPVAGPRASYREGHRASPSDGIPASSPYRILIVDDNVDGAETLAILLRASGHAALTADDGLEALRLAPTFEPDVILLDLGMPKLNGFDTARHIRQQPWGRSVGIVAVTGWGQQKDRDATLSIGFDAHLVKPVAEADLLSTIARVTMSRRQGNVSEDRPGG